MSFWTSLLRSLGLGKAAPIVPVPTVDLGLDFDGGGWGQVPAYNPEAPAAAAESYPWVYAAATRRSAAAASLPVEVYRLVNGERVVLQEHWLYDLLEYPATVASGTMDGTLFRREMWCDLDLSGQAYALIVGKPGPGCSLQRLHPARVREMTDKTGLISYQYDAGGMPIVYQTSQVLRVRRPAMGDDPNQFFHGVGAIQPLDTVLTLEWQALNRAKKASKSGRPAVLVTPDGFQIPEASKRRELAQSMSGDMAKYDVMVASGSVKIEPLGWDQQELEFAKGLDYSRQATLATLQTPPVELGLETANYATAKEQSARFWAGIAADLPMVDGAFWTRLLRLAGERDTYARTSTEGIKELATWRTEAWTRVQTAVFSGVPVEVALESEGLTDVAERMKAAAIAAPVTTPATSEEQARASEASAAWWGGVSAVLRGEETPEVREAKRADRWTGYIKAVHAPSERGLQLAVSRYLRASAQRAASKLPAVWPNQTETRRAPTLLTKESSALVDQILDAIFSQVAERADLDASTRKASSDTFRRAFMQALAEIQEGGADIPPSQVDDLVDAVIGEKLVPYPLPGDTLTAVTDTTYRRLREIVSAGLAEGDTIAQMQSRLILDQGFSASRALNIARTETTRAVSAGQVSAADNTEDRFGVVLEREWLSARDSASRPEHYALDGQRVDRGQSFRIPPAGNGRTSSPEFVGMTALAPGGFGHPAQDCGCRCTVAFVVKEAAKEVAA